MMSASEAAIVTGGRTSGSDARFAGVSTDSRAIGRGELFVALRGERFDGHDFLAAAAARGAAAAMVDRDYPGAYPLSVVIVQDTKRALGDLARALLPGARRAHGLERQDDGEGNARRGAAPACRNSGARHRA